MKHPRILLLILGCALLGTTVLDPFTHHPRPPAELPPSHIHTSHPGSHGLSQGLDHLPTLHPCTLCHHPRLHSDTSGIPLLLSGIPLAPSHPLSFRASILLLLPSWRAPPCVG